MPGSVQHLDGIIVKTFNIIIWQIHEMEIFHMRNVKIDWIEQIVCKKEVCKFFLLSENVWHQVKDSTVS